MPAWSMRARLRGAAAAAVLVMLASSNAHAAPASAVAQATLLPENATFTAVEVRWECTQGLCLALEGAGNVWAGVEWRDAAQ
jgi:hypothetical protein